MGTDLLCLFFFLQFLNNSSIEKTVLMWDNKNNSKDKGCIHYGISQ